MSWDMHRGLVVGLSVGALLSRIDGPATNITLAILGAGVLLIVLDWLGRRLLRG